MLVDIVRTRDIEQERTKSHENDGETKTHEEFQEFPLPLLVMGKADHAS